MVSTDGKYPFEWKRRQFPLRLAFAMTITKSQGQTLKLVGVCLVQDCFSHGQLYVAMSRVGSPDALKYFLPPGHDCRAINIVYSEIFHHMNQ